MTNDIVDQTTEHGIVMGFMYAMYLVEDWAIRNDGRKNIIDKDLYKFSLEMAMKAQRMSVDRPSFKEIMKLCEKFTGKFKN